MDQNLAKKLFEEGGVFILLGVPPETEIGIDLKSWNTEERFRGIKMIPPGIHYIFYSAVGNNGDVAPRSGFFKMFHKEEVIVRKWNVSEGDVSPLSKSEEGCNFRENLKLMDSFLGPFPYDIYEKWLALTGHITESLIDKLSPLSGIVRSAPELEGCSDSERHKTDKIDVGESKSKSKKRMRFSNSQAEDEEEKLLPQLKCKPGTELRYTDFPEIHYPEGSTPSQITQHSMDSSFIFQTMISKYDSPMDIIGEMQFSYICFLVGHNLEAFEHWKKLINLFCSCESAIKKYRKLYDVFLDILKLHVDEIPQEFLADIVTNNNFVYMKIRDLFRNIEASNVDWQLKSKMSRFKQHLTETFSWDFEHLDSEDEENAPVIVDLESN